MKKQIKMVVSDLDGTLLNTKSQVSPATKQAIRDLRKAGILFGVCSGRSAIALKKMLKIWGIEEDVDFVLGFNGAMEWNPNTNQISHQLELPKEKVKDIVKTFQGYPIWFCQYIGQETISSRNEPITRQFARRNKMKYKVERIEQMASRDSGKLMAVGLPWTISRYLKQHATNQDEYRMFRSGPFLIEIVHPHLSKLEGVKKVAEEYGISLDEVVSFGNDNNDIEMLKGTWGIAMNNALESVKKVAKEIAPSNRKDGVAYYINEKILPNLK